MLDLVIQWIGNGFILLATYELSKKNRSCLVYYSLGNVFWAIYSIHGHLWALLALDGALTALNVRAWLKWGKK